MSVQPQNLIHSRVISPHNLNHYRPQKSPSIVMTNKSTEKRLNKDAAKETSRRSVSFHSRTRAKLALHVNEYTEEEMETCWYSDNDYARMKRDILYTVDLIEEKNDALLDDVKYCHRGCEPRTKEGTKQRQRNQRKAFAAVLNEQFVQEEDYGWIIDECRLASVYQERSCKSKMFALFMGICDQKVVSLTTDAETNGRQIETTRAVKAKARGRNCLRSIVYEPTRRIVEQVTVPDIV
jgi:hypothetical protein